MARMSIEQLEKLVLNNQIKIEDTSHTFNDYYTKGHYLDALIEHLSLQTNRAQTLTEALNTLNTNLEPDYGNRIMSRTLRSFYPYWVDRKGLQDREDNLLNLQPSAENWKNGFDIALTQLVLKEGQVMCLNPSIYGWESVDERKENSPLVGLFNLTPDNWEEFAGTFVSEDNHKTGYTLETVHKNGVSQKLRLEGTLGMFIEKLTN